MSSTLATATTITKSDNHSKNKSKKNEGGCGL